MEKNILKDNKNKKVRSVLENNLRLSIKDIKTYETFLDDEQQEKVDYLYELIPKMKKLIPRGFGVHQVLALGPMILACFDCLFE